MTNYLGEFFRSRRVEWQLSLGQLARLAGYRNLNKGMRNILRFERDGTIRGDLLVALAEALDIDWPVVEELAERDRQERLRAWEAWVDEPITPHMIVRYMAAVYGRKPLPDEIKTTDEAERYACGYAKDHRWRVWLVLSRRLSVWISAIGEIESREEARPNYPVLPHSHLRGDKRPLWFDFGR